MEPSIRGLLYASVFLLSQLSNFNIHRNRGVTAVMSRKQEYYVIAIVFVIEALWLYAIFYGIRDLVVYVSDRYFTSQHATTVVVPLPVKEGSVIYIQNKAYRLHEIKEAPVSWAKKNLKSISKNGSAQ